MLTGLPPFYDKVVNDMYRKILHEPLHFPDEDVVPSVARDLLTKLLNRNPAERLGANGSAEIKSHPFFNSVDWRKLLQRKYDPAFKPNVVRITSPLRGFCSFLSGCQIRFGKCIWRAVDRTYQLAHTVIMV